MANPGFVGRKAKSKPLATVDGCRNPASDCYLEMSGCCIDFSFPT